MLTRRGWIQSIIRGLASLAALFCWKPKVDVFGDDSVTNFVQSLAEKVEEQPSRIVFHDGRTTIRPFTDHEKRVFANFPNMETFTNNWSYGDSIFAVEVFDTRKCIVTEKRQPIPIPVWPVTIDADMTDRIVASTEDI